MARKWILEELKWGNKCARFGEVEGRLHVLRGAQPERSKGFTTLHVYI